MSHCHGCLGPALFQSAAAKAAIRPSAQTAFGHFVGSDAQRPFVRNRASAEQNQRGEKGRGRLGKTRGTRMRSGLFCHLGCQ
jgi:hypothetical protein